MFYHGGIHWTDENIYGSIFVFGDKINDIGNCDMYNEIDTQRSTKTTERLINLLKL